MRISKSDVERLLEIVNAQRVNNGLDPLTLSCWSPGDGWTRYRLMSGDESRGISRVCNAREMYETLYTLSELAWHDSPERIRH